MLLAFKILKTCKHYTRISKVLESCLTTECANCSELTFTSFLRILERMEQLE